MEQELRRIFTAEFKQEAVRLTETSGRTVAQVAEDLGIGLSSLARWRRQYRTADLLSGPHEDVQKELARLRRENEILRAERDLLKLDREENDPVNHFPVEPTAFFVKEGSR